MYGKTAVLLIAFGGPQRPEDVRPFLENVVRGRRVPAKRLDEVEHHYALIGGKSPINELTFRQGQALQDRLSQELERSDLPVYVGMRNWHPFLAETLTEMAGHGVNRSIAVIMAPQRSDASWEKYQRNVAEALQVSSTDITLEYTRPFYDHPSFIEAAASHAKLALDEIPIADRHEALLIFTAHSVPLSDPFHQRYADEIAVSARLVSERLSHPNWTIAYQSRSGRPQDPWLEPDINEVLRSQSEHHVRHVVVIPIGFVCDHVEVLYDLDVEAAKTALDLGIRMHRAKTVNDHPLFIECLSELVMERASHQ